MTETMRKGLGLVAVALALWLVSLTGSNEVTALIAGCAGLLGIAGLVVVAADLLRNRA